MVCEQDSVSCSFPVLLSFCDIICEACSVINCVKEHLVLVRTRQRNVLSSPFCFVEELMKLSLLSLKHFFRSLCQRVYPRRHYVNERSKLGVPIQELAVVNHRKKSVCVCEEFLHHWTVNIKDSETIRHTGRDASRHPSDILNEMGWIIHKINTKPFAFQILVGNIPSRFIYAQKLVVELPFNLPKVVISTHDDTRLFPDILHKQSRPICIVATSLVYQAFDYVTFGNHHNIGRALLQMKDWSICTESAAERS